MFPRCVLEQLYAPFKPESRIATNNTTNPLDKEAIQENIVVEPLCLPERKQWLEQLVRRNSTDPLKRRSNRLSKTKSLCNLSSFGIDDGDEDDDDMISLSNLDINGQPLSRYESIEEITKSIDVENRGNAFQLPSAIRKRRSMGNMESLEQQFHRNSRSSSSCHNISPLVTSELRHQRDDVNGEDDDNDDKENKELDADLKDVIETIELPNIMERMQKFQQKDSSSTQGFMRSKPVRRPRSQRPKSYAGEHLNQFVFENGRFRPKNEQAPSAENG